MSKKNPNNVGSSRRDFIRNLAFGIGGVSALYYGLPEAIGRNIDTRLSSIAKKSKDKLGIALVGLGSYSTHQLAPTLQQTKNCYLDRIVTDTPTNAADWYVQLR